jgi:hypothetical protein
MLEVAARRIALVQSGEDAARRVERMAHNEVAQAQRPPPLLMPLKGLLLKTLPRLYGRAPRTWGRCLLSCLLTHTHVTGAGPEH